MHVVIFEGYLWPSFAPLSLSRPVFMLASGMSTLLEKQVRHTNPTRLTLWVRPELADICRRRIVPKMNVPTQINAPLDDEPALILSGRTLHFRKFQTPELETAWIDEPGIIRSAYVKRPGLSPEDAMNRTGRWTDLLELPRMEQRTRMPERLWDLIAWNEEALVEDANKMVCERRDPPAGAYHVVDAELVCIGESASVAPGAVLDASRGPVCIDHHARIGANAVLQGPCYVGPYAQVLPLAHLQPGTSISMMCKVGGTISNSLIFGYTNKSHEGYLGDSYIGKWCNLGSGTTTSNLKNTYGEVSVKTRDGEIKTGRRFLGTLMGDHSRTGIGSRFMAGTYVGFSALIAASRICDRAIPSFSYVTDRGTESYRMEKAIEVITAVYARRDRTWEPDDELILRYVEQMAPGVEPRA